MEGFPIPPLLTKLSPTLCNDQHGVGDLLREIAVVGIAGEGEDYYASALRTKEVGISGRGILHPSVAVVDVDVIFFSLHHRRVGEEVLGEEMA